MCEGLLCHVLGGGLGRLGGVGVVWWPVLWPVTRGSRVVLLVCALVLLVAPETCSRLRVSGSERHWDVRHQVMCHRSVIGTYGGTALPVWGNLPG